MATKAKQIVKNENDEFVSVLTNEPIDPAEGYITDADGNYYTIEEYSIAVDVSAE